jgi:RNA polymerase sigma-70 factor (ECF subfamily)
MTNDEHRFRKVYAAYHRHVFAYCKRRMFDTGSARDCTADTFLVAWRRMDQVPEGDRALPWLYAVARRVVSNHRRSASRRWRLAQKVVGMAGNPAPDPETVVVRAEEDQELLDALERLRPADRELLRLAVWEEMPHAGIAVVLRCSPHAVDQRLYRATRRLARELGVSGHNRSETAAPRPSQRGEAT